jgi:hypothetical protein
MIGQDEKSYKHKRDSIKAVADSLRIKYENDCFGHYQYCPECYNAAISKSERIKRHCPVKISLDSVGAWDENWSYAFSIKNGHYLKVENQIYPHSLYIAVQAAEITENDYPINWQLMSPNVGYWMSDVALKDLHYKESTFSTLTLDGNPINYQR